MLGLGLSDYGSRRRNAWSFPRFSARGEEAAAHMIGASAGGACAPAPRRRAFSGQRRRAGGPGAGEAGRPQGLAVPAAHDRRFVQARRKQDEDARQERHGGQGRNLIAARAENAMMAISVMAGSGGRRAAVVAIRAADLRFHRDQDVGDGGVGSARREAPKGRDGESQGLQENQASGRARKERARQSLRSGPKLRHGFT